MASSDEEQEQYEDDFDEEAFESTQQDASASPSRNKPRRAGSQSSRSSAMYSDEEPFESTYHEASSLVSQLPSAGKPLQPENHVARRSSPLDSKEESASSYSDKFEDETGGHTVAPQGKQVASSEHSQSPRSGTASEVSRKSGPTRTFDGAETRSALVPSDSLKREPDVTYKEQSTRIAPASSGAIATLPSDTAHWRAKEAEEQEFDFSNLAKHGLPMPAPTSRSNPIEVSGSPLPPVASKFRSQDAVPRHLKAHAWDLASLGQEPPQYPREAWSSTDGVSSRRVVSGDTRGFGGTSAGMVRAVEVQVVDNLAKRFIEARKTPGLARQERQAYQSMLGQVAWTALEPHAAQEVALLLSKKWLIPVSSAEALGAFRRCLHSVLTDERVLDIVDHEMKMHFGARTGLDV